MNKNSLTLIVVGIVLISLFITLINFSIWGAILNTSNLGNLEIKQGNPSWQIFTDKADEYDVTIADKNKQKTTISFCHKTITKEMDIGKDQLPNKKQVCKTETSLSADCWDLNKKKKGDKVCYERVVDKETYLTFNPTVIYQSENYIHYYEDWFSLNITLLKNETGNYSNNIESIFIKENPDNYKFGATDDSMETNETASFMYNVISTKPLTKKGNKYYFYKTKSTWFTSTQERHIIDFSDICSRQFNCTGEEENVSCTIQSNCQFTSYEIYQDENTTLYGLNVTFISDKDVDPSIEIFDVSNAESLRSSIDAENNFTHLSVYSENSFSELRGFNLTRRTSNAPYFLDDDNSYGSFDGDSDYVDLNAHVLNVSKEWTLSLWAIKKDDSTTANPFFEFGNYRRLRVENNIVSFRADVVSYEDNENTWTNNQWHHIVATHNITHIIFYQDSNQGDADLITTPFGNSISYNSIIGTRRDLINYFNGSIDKVEIWNQSLTTTDISNLYADGRKAITKRNETYLISQYLFDDSYLPNVFDSTGANNGTFEGYAQYGYDALGLIAYYPFDSNVSSSTVYDYTSNDNDGTITNALFTDSGIYGGAYDFDGVGDYVEIQDSEVFKIIDTLTISAFIKLKTLTPATDLSILRKVGAGSDASYNFIIGGGGDFTNSRLGMVYYSGGSWRLINSDYDIPDLNWHQVLVVFDWENTEIKFYVDGDLKSTKTAPANLQKFNGNIFIGSEKGISKFFNGSIDEVMIFNTALNSTQISDIYNNQSNRFKPAGTQTFKFQNISTGYTKFNLTASTQQLMTSNITGRVGYWDTSRGYKDWDFDESSAVFDGADDYMNLNKNLLDYPENFSLSMWIKRAGTQDVYARYFDGGYSGTSGNYGFNIGSGTSDQVSTSVQITFRTTDDNQRDMRYNPLDNEWHHSIFIKDGTSIKLYVDGIIRDSDTLTISEYRRSDLTYLGGVGSSSSFNGSIDNVLILNRTLSATEIKSLYNAGRTYELSDESLVSSYQFDGDFTDSKGTNDGTAYDNAHIGESSLVSYYHFDEASWDGSANEVVDAMGLNNGTSTNAVTSSDGQMFGRVGSFDGEGDYIDCGSSVANFTSNDNYTISFWGKAVLGLAESEIIGRGFGAGGYPFAIIFKNNQYRFKRYDGTFNPYVVSGTLDNNWHLITSVFDGIKLKIYVDGDFDNSAIDTTTGTVYSEYNFNIGHRTNSALYFNGSIDEVMIFNRSLTEQEIKQLYIKGRAKWFYESPKDFSTETDTQTFNLGSTATHFISDFLFLTNQTYNFFSPLLFSAPTLTQTFWEEGDPVISFNYPSNNSNWNSTSITLNWSIIEGLDDSSWYNINSSTNISINQLNYQTTLTMSEGNNQNITVCANDTSGNEACLTHSFNIDTTFPSIDWVSPTVDEGKKQNWNYSHMNVSASDLNNVSVFIDDGSLVSWWRMDDANSTHILDYIGDNDGRLEGDVLVVDDGKFGKGASFDGNNDYVDLGNINDIRPTTAGTLSAWAKRGNSMYGRIIMLGTSQSEFKGFHITQTSTTNWQVTVGNGSERIDLSTPNTINTWEQIVATFDGQKVSIYVNGILKKNSSFASLTTINYINSDALIGIFGVNNGEFEGQIDDVMIFNKSLTANEIQSLYANQSSKFLEINYTNLAEGSHSYKAYTQDIAGNINSTIRTFEVDVTDPTITLQDPPHASMDTDGVIRFKYTPLDTNTLINCSLAYQDGIYTTATSPIKGVINIIEVTGVEGNHQLYRDDLQWYITCTDEFGNIGNSETRNLDTKYETTGSGGGGGGGGTTTEPEKNPKSVNIFYPQVWYRGTNVEVQIIAYNQEDESYEPPNITFQYSIDGVTLSGIKIEDPLIISNTFQVTPLAQLGNHIINITIQDEKEEVRQLQISIEEKPEDRLLEGISEEVIRIVWWVLGSIGGLALLIILFMAFTVDKKRKKNRNV